MWLMASGIPVRLEMLDQSGQRLYDATASLMHLDETHALMTLEEPISGARLHWGAPVRFELEDGIRRYEITGAIVSRKEEEVAPEQVAASPDVAAVPTWEVRVRVWECSLNVQRRTLPRRKLKFPVRLRVLCANETLEDSSEVRPEVLPGWCVDIGAGGVRIRINRLITVPERMQIEFCLPVSDGAHGVEAAHAFCLPGRVIRAQPHGRHGDSMELALHFERISVRDGMILRSLLA
jgi:hypothetical protein